MRRDAAPSAGRDAAPHRVRVPLNLQHWSNLTFLHWAYPPGVVARLLPPGLSVDTHAGQAWVGVTPFAMRAVRAPGLPPVPHVSFFPEVNVRTYVRNEQGVAGIWFFSLDCARLPVIGALRVIGLPYVWAHMAMQADGEAGADGGNDHDGDDHDGNDHDGDDRDGDDHDGDDHDGDDHDGDDHDADDHDGVAPRRVAYRSRRRVAAGAGPAGVGVRAAVTVGAPIAVPDDLTSFVTARWWAFSWRAGRLWRVPAEHEPWPLHAASARADAAGLFAAAALPAPAGPPMVHFSPGVHSRLGAPRPG